MHNLGELITHLNMKSQDWKSSNRLKKFQQEDKSLKRWSKRRRNTYTQYFPNSVIERYVSTLNNFGIPITLIDPIPGQELKFIPEEIEKGIFAATFRDEYDNIVLVNKKHKLSYLMGRTRFCLCSNEVIELNPLDISVKHGFRFSEKSSEELYAETFPKPRSLKIKTLPKGTFYLYSAQTGPILPKEGIVFKVL